jgi:hypothetical protein
VAYQGLELSRTDQLVVGLSNNSPDRYVYLRDKPEGIVDIPWSLTISNIGNRKISIVRYEFWEENLVGKRVELFYDGLFDANGRRVVEPIVLDAGESIRRDVRIGFALKANAADKVYRTFRSGEKIGAREMAVVLGKVGLDLYGRPLVTPPTELIQRIAVICVRAWTAQKAKYGMCSDAVYQVLDVDEEHIRMRMGNPLR